MSKVKTYEIDSKEKYKIIGEFFDIISNLKSKKETVDFFIGLLTPSEALMMARRIQIAKLIIKDESYENIRKKLKVGFTTIQKTDRWLNGDDEKYCKWIKKQILTKEKNNKKTKLSTNLLDKYSHHRFTKELFL